MLDKQLEFILKISRSQNIQKIHELDIAKARESVNQVVSALGLETITLEKTEDCLVERADGTQLKLRVYYSDLRETKPVFIFYHGGGYALYDIDTHDSLCRYFCRQLDCNVVSVDYRRSPEYVYPEAFNDAVLAASWVIRNLSKINGDPNKVIIGGDSVGGQLAMLVNNELYPEFRFKILLLLYSVFDFQKHYESYQLYGDNYFLDTKTMEWFIDMYFQGEPKENVIDKNSYLRKDLSIYIAVSEFDVLKDSSIEFIDNLESNHANVRYRKFAELPHNFALMAGKIRNAKKALDTICVDVNELIVSN